MAAVATPLLTIRSSRNFTSPLEALEQSILCATTAAVFAAELAAGVEGETRDIMIDRVADLAERSQLLVLLASAMRQNTGLHLEQAAAESAAAPDEDPAEFVADEERAPREENSEDPI